MNLNNQGEQSMSINSSSGVSLGVPNSMRTEAGEKTYQKAKKDKTLVPLHSEEALAKWEDWTLIKNRFPYGLVFTTHHMLVPTRPYAARTDMNAREKRNLDNILNLLQHKYDIIFENTPRQRSIKTLYHIHLATWKQREQVKPKAPTKPTKPKKSTV